MTRAQLVLQFDAVEVALLSDIKLWISASKKHTEAQAPMGSRSRRRRGAEPVPDPSIPKRPKPTLKQFRGEHKAVCCFGGGACDGIVKGEAE